MPTSLVRRIWRAFKAALRAMRRLLVAEQTLGHLQAIRGGECETVSGLLPGQGTLLEIGAGTGWQAQALERRGYVVSAVDLPASKYSADRVFPVIDYNGHTLPFGEDTFDIVYSSNLLEHVPHLDDFEREIHRVLRPDGLAVHVLPSGSWRFWSNLTHPLRYRGWPQPHGEHAANAIEEIGRFSRRAWRRHFRAAGWTVAAELPNRLFYTGSSILDARLGISMRRRLSRLLGSSCHVFALRQHD
jgi:SAM-dependent methyltransferase